LPLPLPAPRSRSLTCVLTPLIDSARVLEDGFCFGTDALRDREL